MRRLVTKAFRSKPLRWGTLVVFGIAVSLWVKFEWEDYYRRSSAMKLSQAVHTGDEDRMRELLAAGVDPDWPTEYGLSARELAKREDCEWCKNVFREFAKSR